MYLTKSITFRTSPQKLSEMIESFDTYPKWNTLVTDLRLTQADKISDGAKVRGTLALSGRDRELNGRIATYREGRQLRLNFSTLLFKATVEYGVRWGYQKDREEQRSAEDPADATVTLSFGSETGFPLIGNLVDRYARVHVSEETLESSLEGLKAHAHIPSAIH